MATPEEPDFPPGHPARYDYDPNSPEAKAWMAAHFSPKGERDWPVGNIKAVDTAGNTNAIPVLPGVDPAHPELQAFTGRTPDQVKAMQLVTAMLSQTAMESPVLAPVVAPAPPPPSNTAPPTGQPGTTPAPSVTFPATVTDPTGQPGS